MLLKVKFCFHRNQIWPLKYQILKMALPHGMSPSFWMHEPKWVILVSYYWKKKFLLNESNNYLLISFIALILRIIAVPFFLGHPVYIYIERERERERERLCEIVMCLRFGIPCTAIAFTSTCIQPEVARIYPVKSYKDMEMMQLVEKESFRITTNLWDLEFHSGSQFHTTYVDKKYNIQLWAPWNMPSRVDALILPENALHFSFKCVLVYRWSGCAQLFAWEASICLRKKHEKQRETSILLHCPTQTSKYLHPCS